MTWKDGGEALFARAVALEWKTRLEAACDCKPLEEALPLDAEPGVRLRILRDRIEEGLHKASPETEAKAARAAGATHLVLWSFEPASVLEGREPLRRTESYHVYELGP